MVLRHLERIFTIFGSIFAIYLGYQLFLRGIEQENVQFSLGKFVENGQGPGNTFIMVGGLAVLIYAIHASLRIESQQTKQNGKSKDEIETVMQLRHSVAPPTKAID